VDSTDEKRSGNLPGKGVRFINRNILVFAFFLLLSFIFWYLNSLGKDLETDIRYPVSYINIPGGNALTGDLPRKLNLYIKGPGYSILRMKISGNSAPLKIDLSRISYKHSQNNWPGEYFIVASGLITGFNSQLKSACKITSVKPDTLFFSLK
jgi:hypothetical protein